MVHIDLPQNDFATLFQNLAVDPSSYLNGNEAVFASAVGSSFYRQILPPGSVTLGWSSGAVQWLSRLPAPIPDHVQPAYSNDPAAAAAFAWQAAVDWQDFLLSRDTELCPGGRLATPDAEEFNDANHGPWTRGLPIRRRIGDGELAYFATWCPAGTSIEMLVK